MAKTLNSETKFCKDCKFYHNTGDGYQARCTHQDSVVQIDYVKGTIYYYSCDVMRDKGTCGTEAIRFEPKEKLLNKIKNWFK